MTLRILLVISLYLVDLFLAAIRRVPETPLELLYQGYPQFLRLRIPLCLDERSSHAEKHPSSAVGAAVQATARFGRVVPSSCSKGAFQPEFAAAHIRG